MPVIPIARIPEDTGAANDRLREFVINRFREGLSAEKTSIKIDALLEGYGDDMTVKVFITDPTLLDQAKVLAQTVRSEIASYGYQALIHVQSWSGSGLYPAD